MGQFSIGWCIDLAGSTDRSLVVLLVVSSMLAGAEVMASPVERNLDTATVDIVSDTGHRKASLTVYLAVSPNDKYTGLSDTTSLGTRTGMLFVYSRDRSRTFVMRNMSFPLDILFFGANGTLRAIYHAKTTDDGDIPSFTGRAQWVLEVNYHWTERNNILPGDRLKSRTTH